MVNFVHGSHLIQAPIGSGKSFLFFDGPLFGLYKHRARPILNKQAKTGTVQVLFSLDEQTRLIERSISPTTKGGESVKTKLWEVNNLTQEKDGRLSVLAAHDILNYTSKHLSSIIDSQYLSLIEFTNSKEVDNAISELLPPKEVLMSVNILMQESQSVFELAPADRVQVFKHLFGLLGIDEAKERINERRKELQTTINIIWDDTLHSQKLQIALTQIKTSLVTLTQQYTNIDNTGSKQGDQNQSYMDVLTKHMQTWFFADLWLIQEERIGVQDFSFTEHEYERINALVHTIEIDIARLTQAQWEKQERAKHTATKKTELEKITHQSQQLKIQLEHLSEKKKHMWSNATQDLTKQKKVLHAEQEKLEATIPWDALAQYGTAPSHGSELDLYIQDLVNQWTTLADQIAVLEKEAQNIQNSEKEIKQELLTLEQQKKHLQESHAKQSLFECDKIQGPCPYVDMINKNAVWALKQQSSNVSKQEELLKQKLEEQGKAKILNKKALQEKKVSLTSLKSFLKEIGRKSLQTTSKKLATLRIKSQDLDKKLQAEQSHQDLLISIEKEELQKQTQQNQIQIQIKELSAAIMLHEKQVSHGDTTLDKELLEHLQAAKQTTQDLHQTTKKIQEIATEYKQQQIKTKKLQEQLQITKELHHIFSKELMIVVLQDFLPALQEIINSYLSQIVDYEIRFVSPDLDGAQLELDIEIIDSKWTRKVKSLSGGQKTILKLVWMLSVATLFKSSFLFLDETINNLDTNTIAQVADVLKEFVEHSSCNFYVVTHSPQIQQMSSWDSVISIEM